MISGGRLLCLSPSPLLQPATHLRPGHTVKVDKLGSARRLLKLKRRPEIFGKGSVLLSASIRGVTSDALLKFLEF